MDWSLVKLIDGPLLHEVSIISAFISLIIFILSARKATHSVRAARALTRHLYQVRSNIRRSIDSLRREHAHLRGEIKNLDEKILESSKICEEIDRNIAHMTKLRGQLQQELIHAHGTSRRVEHKNHNVMAGRPYNSKSNSNSSNNSKNLPVFVRRRAEKSYPSVM